VSLQADYFDRMYAEHPDPWGLQERWYEQRKYALSVAALPRQRYASGFEPGCSVGVLSELLAARCHRLLSCDSAKAPVAAATQRLQAYPHVTVEQRSLPAPWPAGRFDLVVLSEVLYYFDDANLATVLNRALTALEPGGTLVLVHWRHPVADYPQSGDAVHEAARRLSGLARVGEHREPDFLLDSYVRDDHASEHSVAADEGLA
jgi:SAM-dependent methyltransferase